MGCTEHDEYSGVAAEERVEEEKNQEKAEQTQMRWTSQRRMATVEKTLVEVQQMAVVTQVVDT